MPSITRNSIPGRAWATAWRSMAGVRSVASTSTSAGTKGRSAPVPQPMITSRSPGRRASSSIERRRSCGKLVTRS